MIEPPPGVGVFEFVVLSTLRAAQLMRGCRPRVAGTHKATVIAQGEVAAGLVTHFGPGPLAGVEVLASSGVLPVAAAE